MSESVHLVAVGARTPLGMNAAQSAAAYRAGINAMREHPFMIDRVGNPMLSALDSQLDPALNGPERLLALAEPAVREACAPLRRLGGLHQRLPLYLGLSEFRPGFAASEADAIAAGFSRFDDLPIDVSEMRVSTAGHAAGLSLLAGAVEQIEQGSLEGCVLGGVDSYLTPDTMECIDANRQLPRAEARSAFVPGEGAGCCVLVSGRARRRFGLESLASVRAASVSREAKLIKTTDVCVGTGLTAAVKQTTQRLVSPSERINAVICDINGERYRGEEWGCVCLRLSQHFDDPSGYWSPADCWGDVGAASGPLFAIIACEAAARGYSKGPLALLWASSEMGLRAAALLNTADGA